MSITSPNNQKGKKGKKNNQPQHNLQGSKFIAKPGKAASAKRPHKAGGTRGS